MLKKILGASVVAAGVAFLPLGLQAQAADPGAGEAVATTQTAVMSASEIAARIQSVQRQAMQDPALTAANREIGALITAALPRVDPAYPTYARRAQTLQAEIATARAASDNAKLLELAEETKQLQASINTAQEQAKEDPEVKRKLEAFKVDLFTKMVAIDPTVQELVKQLEALQSKANGSGS